MAVLLLVKLLLHAHILHTVRLHEGNGEFEILCNEAFIRICS